MANPQLPAPGANRSESDPPRQKRPLPTNDEILERLDKLNGLVALGLISPAQASVMQRNYKIMIEARRPDGGKQPVLSTESLADLVKADPKLVSQLESILSDDQIAWLMEQAKKG